MSSTNPTVSEIARLQAASEWVQRLNELVGPALADQWMEWCKSDPLNLPAFEQMQGVWDGFAGVQNSSPSPHRVDPKTAESWRDGILQFVGDPLEEVAGEVNLYSARKIIVASALRRTLFTGTVSAANVDDWLKALEQIFSVDIVDQGINGIHIRLRDEHGNHE